MSDVIPMTSVKLGPGRYKVTGMYRRCVLVRTLAGWELVLDDEAVAVFRTRREALQFCQQVPSL